MKKLRVPGTGLEITNICLGTARFGSEHPEEECFRILDRYMELGGNAIDTANAYASFLPGGTGMSERTIGRWLRRSGARDRLVIATKGGHPSFDSMDVPRLSPEDIRGDLTESLDRLGLDSVDLYWLHMDDPGVPVSGLVDTMNELLSQGLVKAAGASNWSTERLEEARRYAEKTNRTGFFGSQVAFSLAEPNPGFDNPGTKSLTPEDRPYYAKAGLVVAAYSPHAKGFFSGKYDRGMTVSTEKGKRVERARELADRLGWKPNDVALAYIFSQPFDVAAVVGPRNVEQIEASCAAADLALSADQLRFLEEGRS
jgi:aryl-alcohol dehydrogenase-like predicted oxidoreductase